MNPNKFVNDTPANSEILQNIIRSWHSNTDSLKLILLPYRKISESGQTQIDSLINFAKEFKWNIRQYNNGIQNSDEAILWAKIVKTCSGCIVFNESGSADKTDSTTKDSEFWAMLGMLMGENTPIICFSENLKRTFFYKNFVYIPTLEYLDPILHSYRAQRAFADHKLRLNSALSQYKRP